MKPEERDLLAAYAHGLLEGDERRRAAELSKNNPQAREELRAIRQTLDETAGWEPEIPGRLNEMPIPALEIESSASGKSWWPSLMKAAALLMVGFSLGYAIRPGGSMDLGVGQETVTLQPVAATPTPTPRVRQPMAVASNDLLANGIAAYLGYSVATNKDLSTYINKAPELFERLPEASAVWDAISGGGREETNDEE